MKVNNMHWHHPQIRPNKLGQRFRVIEGDRFALIRWSFLYGPMIETTDISLGGLMGEAPDYLNGSDSDRLAVCEIFKWVEDTQGGREAIPIEINTLYEIDWYADPDEEYDDAY